jgi:hypothetical protein
VQHGLDLSRLDTVGDLIAFGRAVQRKESRHDADEAASRTGQPGSDSGARDAEG